MVVLAIFYRRLEPSPKPAQDFTQVITSIALIHTHINQASISNGELERAAPGPHHRFWCYSPHPNNTWIIISSSLTLATNIDHLLGGDYRRYWCFWFEEDPQISKHHVNAANSTGIILRIRLPHPGNGDSLHVDSLWVFICACVCVAI